MKKIYFIQKISENDEVFGKFFKFFEKSMKMKEKEILEIITGLSETNTADVPAQTHNNDL